jgi:hypothetical protein
VSDCIVVPAIYCIPRKERKLTGLESHFRTLPRSALALHVLIPPSILSSLLQDYNWPDDTQVRRAALAPRVRWPNRDGCASIRLRIGPELRASPFPAESCRYW